MVCIELEPWIEKQIPPNLVDHFKNLRKDQLALQKRVIIEDHPSLSRISLVAGCDVSYFSNGDACAGIAVLEIPSLTQVEYVFYIYTPKIDYVPTFLAYREAPGIVEAYKKLQNKPDLIVVDGNGILHPHKLGIASHLGIILNKPTIGVAKRLLIGSFDEQILLENKFSPVMYKNQEIGAAVVTNQSYKPIYISPGNLLSIQTARSLISRYTRQRLPEPIRLADKLTRDTVKDLE
ncbi:endonuclease V [Candidatus Heimdallarchaeota archaeon B3_Heim]|nr:MAG: endonuclease V [Candidatus Heimdallarchaeota archaeon B3_Heim]